MHKVGQFKVVLQFEELFGVAPPNREKDLIDKVSNNIKPPLPLTAVIKIQINP